MKKISSGYTFYYKRIFPIAWLTLVVLFLVAVIVHLFTNSVPVNTAIFFIAVPLLLFPFGLILFHFLVFCLVDEVHYDEKSLLVKNGNIELKIPFNDIKDIKYKFSNPPRIEVTLYTDTELGNIIKFTPPGAMLIPFTKHPDVKEFLKTFRK